MKKHKHEALIKEWLDNGTPPVEYRSPGADWVKCAMYPSWFESSEYRIVYPPKPKKQVKMLCWLRNDVLIWRIEGTVAESYLIQNNGQRVPSEDKIVEVEA